MRPEELVGGGGEKVTAKLADVDQAVGPGVDRIDESLSAASGCHGANGRHVHNGSDRIGGQGNRHEPGRGVDEIDHRLRLQHSGVCVEIGDTHFDPAL